MMDHPSWRFRPPPPPSPFFPHHHHPYDRQPFIPPPTPQFPSFHDPRFAPPPLPHTPPARSFPDDPTIERDLLYKRMRLDDGVFLASSSVDERRLNLIRDHGRNQHQHQHQQHQQQPPVERRPPSIAFDWTRSDQFFPSHFLGAALEDPKTSYPPQQIDNLGREENLEPRRDHTVGRELEFRYAPPAQRSSGEWTTSSYEHQRDSIKDISHYADPREKRPHLEPYAINRKEIPEQRENLLREWESPIEPNAPPRSRGIHLPLESFSPPSSDARVPLPVTSGLFSSSNVYPPPPALPRVIPSPPPEPSAPYQRPPIFPVVSSLAKPPQGDQLANLSTPPLPPLPPPPLPPPHEAMVDGQAYLQAFPSNIGVSSFPVDAPTMMSTNILQTARNEYRQECPFPPKQPMMEKPVIMDASHIFRKPHRTHRPDHFVIILRGLPGSGKSYMAKLLRDIEVEEGGSVPRIHSMDDYFMTEVEKNEDAEGEKSSISIRSKKHAAKTVMEYCYEPEMEEAYRASMLKAFKKTLEEGTFTFVIVDDRNLRVADFAQFWAIGKRSGYEVYLLEAKYKDPTGCAARNVHGFTSDDTRKMAEKWEEAPPLYLQLDTQALFHVDGLDSHDIQEVDMDLEDEVAYDEKDVPKIKEVPEENVSAGHASPEFGRSWDAEDDSVKDLGRSKWSKDLDFDDMGKSNGKERLGALSGLVQMYGKPANSVSWGDQGGRRGFAIGASKKSADSSLIIGPGSGYNLSSNPLPDEEAGADTNGKNISKSKKHTLFLEHLQAERESFKLVFDRRRQRIGISDAEDE